MPGQQRKPQLVVLSQVAQRWGRLVRHVFDRGEGLGPWLWQLCRCLLRFVVRWKKGNKLIDACGQERKAWEMARGKRAWGEARLLWDTHCRLYRSTRVLARPLRPPEYRGQWGGWWYDRAGGVSRGICATSEPVETTEQAADIVFSSVSRWKIEERFRFQKGERLISALRLQGWQARRTRLLVVTLASGLLLTMLGPPLWLARSKVLLPWGRLAPVEG